MTGKCAECSNDQLKMQRRAAADRAEPAAPPSIVHEVLRSPGQPLNQATRAYMEPRFGHDFSQVRVHTNTRAAESASSVNALAFTIGSNVVFAERHYAPETSVGRRLIAHELTHVIQQKAHPANMTENLDISEPESAPETVAERVALGRIGAPISPLSAGAYLQKAGPGNVKAAEPGQVEDLAIQPGDVVVRTGTFSGKNPLASMIHEPYNHGGIALSSTTIHHVESNGYEIVSKKTFFDPANASGGAIIRFDGPFATQIRARAVNIASAKRYVKIPGNPFSTSEDLKTVNCNEFVHELFRQAIAELTAESQKNNPQSFPQYLAEYGDPAHAGKAKELIAPKDVKLETGGMTTGPATKIAELAGSYGVNKEAAARGEVTVKFEGRIEIRNLYPEEWAKSWNPFKVSAYQDGFYTVAVLRTYTPDSFVNSKYFSLVRRVTAGEQ